MASSKRKKWMGEQFDMDQSEIKEKNEWMIVLIAQSKNKEKEQMSEWIAQSEIIEKEWMTEWPLSVKSWRALGWSYVIVVDKSFTIVSEYFASPAYCIVWAGYIQGKSSNWGLASWI